jgi:hypothetical protein
MIDDAKPSTTSSLTCSLLGLVVDVGRAEVAAAAEVGGAVGPGVLLQVLDEHSDEQTRDVDRVTEVA